MDAQRKQRILEIMTGRDAKFHALICRLPEHVLMLTGYQPILGNSFCLLTISQALENEVEIRLAVPEDEANLIPPGTATQVITFAEETMNYVGNTIQAVHEPLGELLRSARLSENAVVGYEGVYSPIASGYTQVGVPGPATLNMYRQLFLGGYMQDAASLLDELESIKTGEELGYIRRSEEVARQGFLAARDAIRVGSTEAEVAAAMTAALLSAGYAAPGAHHVQPFVHVMAGVRAADAYKAFNLTSNAAIQQGDTVLVQVEIGIDGYWAELTRTFFAGDISEDWRMAHKACMVAQDAALQIICDGVPARDADSAARSAMAQAGFRAAFKHGLGHGFGFQAINHAAAPVLHPASSDILQSGMVHNMEPAVYIEGKGGLRLNDNVLVLPNGNEVLSRAIPRDLDWLVAA